MRINDGSLSGVRIDRQHEVDSARGPMPAGRSIAGATQDGGDTANAGALTQLIADVNASPDVRPQVVEEVSRRLSMGLYDTRSSADLTAEAILSSAD